MHSTARGGTSLSPMSSPTKAAVPASQRRQQRSSYRQATSPLRHDALQYERELYEQQQQQQQQQEQQQQQQQEHDSAMAAMPRNASDVSTGYGIGALQYNACYLVQAHTDVRCVRQLVTVIACSHRMPSWQLSKPLTHLVRAVKLLAVQRLLLCV
jgi:hypothetical protein